MKLAIALILAATTANAQQRHCELREDVIAKLAEKFGETRRSIGINTNGNALEMFANDETGTWTITVTPPGGPTCLVAYGRSYEAIADSLPPQGDDL